MFEKFGIQSAEWRCYADNKEALKLYRRIIKDYGGREVDTLRKNGAPQNRKICDTVIFEILKTDLCWKGGANKILTKKEFSKYLEEENEFYQILVKNGWTVKED
jgi:hypothetical protein